RDRDVNPADHASGHLRDEDRRMSLIDHVGKPLCEASGLDRVTELIAQIGGGWRVVRGHWSNDGSGQPLENKSPHADHLFGGLCSSSSDAPAFASGVFASGPTACLPG